MAKPGWSQFIKAGYKSIAILTKDGQVAVNAEGGTVHINHIPLEFKSTEPIDTSAILTGSVTWSITLTDEQAAAFQRFFLPEKYALQMNKADGTPVVRILFASHEAFKRWYDGEVVTVDWEKYDNGQWVYVETTPFKFGGVKIEDS